MKQYAFLFEEGQKTNERRFDGNLNEAAKKAARAAKHEAKERSSRIVVSVKSIVNHQIAEYDYAV